MDLFKKEKFNAKDSGLIFSITILAVIIMSFAVDFIALAFKIDAEGSLFYYASIIFTQGTFFLTAVLYCKINGISLFKATEISRPLEKKNLIISVITGCTMIFALTVPAYYFIELLKELGYKTTEYEMTEYNSVFWAIVDIIFIGVFPAICEELIFRGIILQGLRKFGDVSAIVISALMFMVMHENPEQTLYPFLSGLVLGIVFVKTGNIKYTVIIHFLNNAISVLSEFFYSYTGTEYIEVFLGLNYVDLTLVAIGTVIFIAVMVYLLKKKTVYKEPLQPKILKPLFNLYIPPYNIPANIGMPYNNGFYGNYNRQNSPYMNNRPYNPYTQNAPGGEFDPFNLNGQYGGQNSNTQSGINNGQGQSGGQNPNMQYNPYTQGQKPSGQYNPYTQGQNPNPQYNPYMQGQNPNPQYNPYMQNNFNPYITGYNPYAANNPYYNVDVSKITEGLFARGYIYNPKNHTFYLPEAADIKEEIPPMLIDVSKDPRINPYYTTKGSLLLYSLFGIAVSIALWFVVFFS